MCSSDLIPGNPPDGNSIVEQDHAANPAYADGFADGEAYRTRRQAPPAYLLSGFDDYAQGFQAGFYTGEALRPRLGTVPRRRRDDE